MAKLTEIDKSTINTAPILRPMLPRGPAWDPFQPFLDALVKGTSEVLLAAYNRIVALLKEADPRTAVQTLSDWLVAWGVPGPGETLATTFEGRRAQLVGKVAAQGGQSRAYFVQVVRTILEDDAAVVTIIERPYGPVFAAWTGHAWDTVTSVPHQFHWWVEVPIGPSSPKWEAIEQVLAATKPAHTVVTLIEA